MKQKVLIKISMESHKSRTKALKIVAGVSGVESAALKGDDKSQIEVTGNGMDPVVLTCLLRKKVGYAELMSVAPAGGGDKKEGKKENEVNIQPLQYWPVYHGGVTDYDYPVLSYYQPYDPCSIM